MSKFVVVQGVMPEHTKDNDYIQYTMPGAVIDRSLCGLVSGAC